MFAPPAPFTRTRVCPKLTPRAERGVAGIVEVIVNNATALVVYAVPASPDAGLVHLVGAPADPSTARLQAWALADPGHHYG